MNRFLFAAICLCSFALILGADSQLFAQDTKVDVGGKRVFCTTPNGQAVRWFSRPDLNDVGYTTAQGILYNPTVLSRFSNNLQLFWLGHECGHAHLGTTNESLADCWSAQTGVKQGWFDSSDADDLAREMKGNPGDNSHPPGPERVANVRSCMQQASSRSPGDGQAGSGRAQIPANQPPRVDRGSLPVPKDPTPRNRDISSMCSKLNEVVNDEPDLVAVIGDDRTPHSTFATTELPLAKDCYVLKTSKPVYKCNFKKDYFRTLISEVAACFPDASKTGDNDLITIRLKKPESVYFRLSTMDDESYIEVSSH